MMDRGCLGSNCHAHKGYQCGLDQHVEEVDCEPSKVPDSCSISPFEVSALNVVKKLEKVGTRPGYGIEVGCREGVVTDKLPTGNQERMSTA
jgi:hypothetical protein